MPEPTGTCGYLYVYGEKHCNLTEEQHRTRFYCQHSFQPVRTLGRDKLETRVIELESLLCENCGGYLASHLLGTECNVFTLERRK